MRTQAGQGRGPGLHRAAMLLVLAFAVSACVTQDPLPAPIRPGPQPVSVESPASLALQQRYAQVQDSLLSRGLMRTDGGGADTPFTPEITVAAFRKIAFFEEYDRAQGGVVRQEAPIRMARWATPLRVSIRFGASTDPARAATDRARATSFLARLSGLTGLTIRQDDSNPNFVIQFASLDERDTLAPSLARAIPGLTPAQVQSVTNLDRDTFCLVWTEVDDARSIYERAFVLIPSEHPDLMRLSCLHEELAQALGLPNDSPRARPSVFNDDEEFALLTRMDEVMLRMLYAPDLAPGMTEAQALPLLLPLARRLIGAAT
jgi:hypothetical protein